MSWANSSSGPHLQAEVKNPPGNWPLFNQVGSLMNDSYNWHAILDVSHFTLPRVWKKLWYWRIYGFYRSKNSTRSKKSNKSNTSTRRSKNKKTKERSRTNSGSNSRSRNASRNSKKHRDRDRSEGSTEDSEDFFSASDEEFVSVSSNSDKAPRVSWTCEHCTYVNNPGVKVSQGWFFNV